MTEPVTPPPAAPPPARPKAENPLTNLLLNVLLPVVVLSHCSREEGFLALGPKWALVVAMLFPIGYQIWDYRLRRKWNLFSIIGFISVLLTGGLGLLNTTPQTFALKEASIPAVLAALIYFSQRTRKPLVRTLLLNPDVMDVQRVENALREHGNTRDFENLLRSSTLILALTMLGSAVLNYFLALYFLEGTEAGTEARTQAIGRQTGWGYLVIGVPTLVVMVFAMLRLFRGIRKLTGLEMEQILLPR